MKQSQSANLSQFTNLYSLQKTLRFELKPVGADGRNLSENEAANLLKNILEEDKKIEKAYNALKPVLDKVHENIINNSLNSKEAKEIDFLEYFDEYKKGKESKLDTIEKSLREKIGKTFEIAGNEFARNAGMQEKGIKCLTEAGILKYIEKNINNLVPEDKVNEFINEIEKENDKGKKQIERIGHLETFNKFFTYLEGYNENRKNYYEFKKEETTSVATRIVHENLPKFCDNAVQFSEIKKVKDKKTKEEKEIPSRKDDYLNALKFLKDNNRSIQIKDAKTNSMIEAISISEEWFSIDKFKECLSQSGIEEYNRVIGHYNLLINLYNQAIRNENGFHELSPFKTLYKQIGCGEKKEFFFELKYFTKAEEEKENYKEKSSKPINLEETLKLISNAGDKYFKSNEDESIVTVHTFINWVLELDSFDGIYFSKAAVDKISNSYLANWHSIKDKILEGFNGKDKNFKDILNSIASYDNKREEKLKIKDAVELSVLFEILDQDKDEGWSQRFFKESILENKKKLIDENQTPSKNLIKIICDDIKLNAKEFCKHSEEILLINDFKDEVNILKIKHWLDLSKSTLWIIKYFQVKESKIKGNSINPKLSNLLTEILRAEDADWFGWYDLVRNFLTKKPQEDAKKNKLKLNFGNPNLLSGWDQEFESKAGLIFEKNGLYYLALNNKKLSKDEIDSLKKNADENLCNRIILDFQKPDNKNVPRLFIRSKGEEYAPAVSKYNLPIDEVIDIYDNGKFKTEHRKIDIEEYKRSLHKLIDYFKKGFKLHESYKHYNFSWKDTKEYNDISEFYFDTEISCYSVKFEKINWSTFLEFVKNERIYLFQIYNKDFSKNKKATSIDNMHTYYWKLLFDKENLKNIIYKLNGKAEIFFREAAIKERQTHLIGEKMINKKEKNFKNTIPKTAYRELFLLANNRIKVEDCKDLEPYLDKFNRIDESKVSLKDVKHEIIKDKRFTESKFQLHLSITLNFKANNKENINELVNNHFPQSEDIQFLGIDRGEKHLIYFSLLNSNGEIVEQGNFDVINNKDYLKEINEAANIRRQKQENWQQKGNISNLKDGYISLVIHEIIEKMKGNDGKYKPTFIILEDLNIAFKRFRQKFEQQVYQKFEVALAKKLNYLVDKKATIGEIGSVTNALQLTPPITIYGDIENKKQVGVMLYTRANYTSITDPETSWRKTIYLKTGSEKFIKDKILEVFTEIAVDEHGDYFFQYNEIHSGKKWTLWSGKNGKSLERYRAKKGKDKNQYIIESFDIKQILDHLFSNFEKTKSLKKQIQEGKELIKVNDHTSWETLRFCIDLIMQIRNSGDLSKNQNDNFLLSPVRNDNEEHFDSRIYEKQENPKLPKDGDANGAYNIARKGMIMFEHIKHWVSNGKQKIKKNDKDIPNLDLFISDEEWDLYNTNKTEWEKRKEEFVTIKEKKDSK